MWWLWPHFKRVWAGAGTFAAGLAVNYVFALMGKQSVPSLRDLTSLLYGYWYLTGGFLILFAIISMIAERAHRLHAAPCFIGEERGRKGAKLPPLAAATTTASNLVVGRDDELQQLRDWYANVVQGERRIVFVSGEAGIGKTTFVNTFIDSLRREGVRIARGQCVEQYGAGEPYMPMLEALTQLGRGAGSQQLLAILHRLAPAWLAQLPALLTAEERARIQGETQGLTQQRMLREMAQTLAALASDAPLVLLLEDLHWSDASTLDLIAAIARRTEPARLLILGTYRPVEMLAGHHPLRALKEELEVHQQCQELRLKLLSEAEVAAYLKQRFASDGVQYSGLAPAIYQRTDGNALFMVNVVDYLVAQGSSLDTSKIETPRNIRQMIERNLRRLDADEQAVLEAASVAGAEFSAAAVAAALERPASEIDACCTRLARNEQFIRSQGASRWPDGTLVTGYRFAHALYQEVLYDHTPVVTRAEAHRRIAAREETAYGEQAGAIAAELAYHFGKCGDEPKALKFKELAGERALTRRAFREAEQHFRDALALLNTLPESSERDAHELNLQVALGRVITATHGFSAVATAQAFARAKILAERIHGVDSLKVLDVLNGLRAIAATRGEMRAALALAEQMLEIARRIGSPRALTIAHNQEGNTHYYVGDLVGARKHFLCAIAQYSEKDFVASSGLNFLDQGVGSLVWLGATEWFLGRPTEALRYTEDAEALAHRQNNPFNLANVYAIGSHLHSFRGDFQRAFEAAEEAVRLSAGLGFPVWNILGRVRSAWARAQMGQTTGAVNSIEQAIKEFDNIRFYLARALYLCMLCETQIATGAVDDALVSIERALRTNPEELLYRPLALTLRGRLRFRNERAAGHARSELAERDFREAIELAGSMSAKSWELRATTSLARLLASQGRRDEARPMLAAIYNWFTEGFDTADLIDAKALLEKLS